MLAAGEQCALQLTNLAPADRERHRSKNSKAAIDEAPSKGNAADVPGNQSKGKDGGTGNQAPCDDSLVTDRIDPRADESCRDDQMSEGQPICAVGKEGILRIGTEKTIFNPIDPGQQSGRLANRLQRF